jgi:hypothetical protein
MNADKDFAPYQPSLDMKELGFDEPCFGYYNVSNQELIEDLSNNRTGNDDSRWASAPLYSQAFRWFREKYNLNVFIQNGTSSWMAFIGNTPSYIPFVDEVEGSNEFKGHNTYEEAELACLNKLIEIVKNK